MPLPRSAEEFIQSLRTHLAQIKSTLHTAQQAESTLISEPFEPTHYEVLFTITHLLRERAATLSNYCYDQHTDITDNCEVAVQERLTHIEQPPDDPMPY
jgi:hypothetical protein